MYVRYDVLLMLVNRQMFMSSKYYKGGFDPKMTKREAALVLGISSNSAPHKVKVRSWLFLSALEGKLCLLQFSLQGELFVSLLI